ncbi:MAG TPA: hypothetical protein VIY28_14025 [Pseudonocardiaceae bacterium]
MPLPHGVAERNPLGDVLAARQLSLAGLARLYIHAVAADGLRSSADRNLMWKWKTGRRTPTPESQGYLADALGVPRSVIVEEGWPQWLRHAIDRGTSVLESPWSLAGTMQVLHELTGGPMDRRGFAVITAGALTALVRNWGDAVAGSSPEAGLHGSSQDRLNPDLLDRLGGRLADLRNLDDALGGTELRSLAVAEFRWLVHLADHAGYDTDSGRRLFSLTAEAARLCGWLHFDALHHAAAQSYYVSALRCSATADDSMAGANVLACMSWQAALTDHHQDAVSLIDSAQQQVRHNATPRLAALLAIRKARAYAKAGDVVACGRALVDAERSLDAAATAVTETEPDWLYYFDEAELAAQAASCWIDLRQPARARPLIDHALRSINPNYVRDRAIYHARSAEAYLHENELEPACHELLTATDLARYTGSVHALETIRTARLGMSPHDHNSSVRELDDHFDVQAPRR